MTTKLYLEVIGDTNDGDYISSRTEITQEDFDKLLPLITAVAKKRKWLTTEYIRSKNELPKQMYAEFTVPEDQINWDDEESMKKDLVGWFNEEYVPHGECGIHSIVEINLLEIVNTTKFINNRKNNVSFV